MSERSVAARPTIVGLGGTNRPGSSSEKALRLALAHAQAAGAEVELFSGRDLDLPTYNPGDSARTSGATNMIAALRRADGILLASPGYHGSISGLVKNALDYVEDMRNDPRPYFEGRAVGLIACAAGYQATGSTLISLRSVVHALRGWPTPYAVAINTAVNPAAGERAAADDEIDSQLNILALQVVQFVRMRAALAREMPGT
jgi:FMN reductase